MELVELHVPVYMALSKLATVNQVANNAGVVHPSAEWYAQSLIEMRDKVLPGIRSDCQQAGFDLAVQQIDKTVGETDPKKFFDCLEEVHSRIFDYMETRAVFIISPTGANRYDNPLSGWEQCCAKFPSATDHIEEASKCLALGRNTACVFHLAGVVQEALEALSIALAVKLDPYTDTWNALINKVESAMRAKSSGTPKKAWKPIEAFYAELLSDIKAVKNAWRNPTVHFRKTYSDEQAEKIYSRVQEFMQHASTKLRGRKV